MRKKKITILFRNNFSSLIFFKIIISKKKKKFNRRASDPLTWHVVPFESSLAFTQDDSQASRDVRILLNVAPRTKLGCG